MSMKCRFIVKESLQQPPEPDFVASWTSKTFKNLQKPSKNPKYLRKTTISTLVEAMYVLRVKCEPSWTTASVKKSFETRLRTSKTFKTPLKLQKTMFLTFANVFYAKLWWCVVIQKFEKTSLFKNTSFSIFFENHQNMQFLNFFLGFGKCFEVFEDFWRLRSYGVESKNLLNVFGLKKSFYRHQNLHWGHDYRFLNVLEGFRRLRSYEVEF